MDSEKKHRAKLGFQKQKRIKERRGEGGSFVQTLTLRPGGVVDAESGFVLHADESGVVVVVHDEGCGLGTLLASVRKERQQACSRRDTRLGNYQDGAIFSLVIFAFQDPPARACLQLIG